MSTVTSECRMGCSEVVFPGRYHIDPEPPEYCPEDAMPHSEYCEAHGGSETDLEAFLEEWTDWVDTYSGVCEHIRDHHEHDETEIEAALSEKWGREAMDR